MNKTHSLLITLLLLHTTTQPLPQETTDIVAPAVITLACTCFVLVCSNTRYNLLGKAYPYKNDDPGSNSTSIQTYNANVDDKKTTVVVLYSMAVISFFSMAYAMLALEGSQQGI